MRRPTQVSAVLTDVVAWIVATDVAALARYDFAAADVHWAVVSALALGLACGQLVIGGLLQMYSGRYQVGTFDEVRPVAVSATTVAVLGTTVVALLAPSGLPRSLPFLAWPIAMLVMGSIRLIKRVLIEVNAAPKSAERVLVLGAGRLGASVVKQMLHSPDSTFLPVGFLDDDPTKRHRQLHGLRVRGRFADIGVTARTLGVTKVVVAVDDADAALLRKIADAASEAGIGCLVMPPLKDILQATQLSSLREIAVEDVIGRRPANIDICSIANYVTGRRVLVTGAGGSIGSQLCSQLHRYGPSDLVLLDRDESALHAVELSLYRRALLESSTTVLADIRDADAVDQVFLEYQPHVVFHAAALKHVTLLERYPYEALRSNVTGTLNLLQAAEAHGVERFVNISTDKAVNPTSALGHSKQLAERLTSWFALSTGSRFLSVRFGNVLGSRGSVLTTFAAQIESGGPVTVTDPDVSRFFMTIEEACQLVIQAGAIGEPGETLVLDMGEPTKIIDVARRMIAMSGRDVKVVFTGLRPGEKLTEELVSTDEVPERRFHSMISHVRVPPLAPHEVFSQPWAQSAAVRAPSLRLDLEADLGVAP